MATTTSGAADGPSAAPRVLSASISSLLAGAIPLFTFFTQSAWARRIGEPGISDFVVGNPHDGVVPGFAEALQRWSVPQRNDWFAYKMSEPAAQDAVAASLRNRFGMPFQAEDVSLTNGAFAALAVTLRAVADPGDEVIYLSPPWFFYRELIGATGAVAVRVPVRADNFDLDLAAIEAAISPRTRAIIVNSPNNPTGKIYPPETLQGLADLLTRESARNGRTIYLLSDEAYNQIIFDDGPFQTPTAFYPSSFLLYTYGKTLLTPGQRLGYVALPPAMPEPVRAQFRLALLLAQLVTGYAFPNALLQHALPDLEALSIDIAHLQRKRDRMVAALRAMGYELHVPEGTFYLLPRSPLADDFAFVDLLTEHDVFVLPGTLVELPGFFRISLTATDAMIDRALPGFAAALERARSTMASALA